MTVRIAASLWSVDADRQATVARDLAIGGIARLHWDASDGTLGPAGGFDTADARRLAPPGVAHEAHLMSTDPLTMLDEWLPLCDTIAIHADLPTTDRCIERIRDAGVQPVLAVAGGADLSDFELDPGIGILVMAVRPGHAGTAFEPAAYATVSAARDRGHHVVGVDGSVTAQRGRDLVAAGATWLVSGTSLTSSDPRRWRAAVEQQDGAPRR